MDEKVQMTEANISKYKEVIDQMKAMKENNCILKRNISKNLMQIKNDIRSHIRELEEECKAKGKFLEKQNEKLGNQITETEGKQKELEKVKDDLVKAKTPVEFDNAIKEANILLQTMKSEESRNQQIHQGIKKRMETTEKKLKRIKEVLTSPVEAEHELLKQLAVMTPKAGDKVEISPQILQRMSTTMRFLVSLEGLYAVKQEGEVTRYGKLSLSHNKLCLHHLSETQPPTNVSVVNFDDVIKLVKPSSRLTFLQFGNDERRLCKSYIRLRLDTKRAQNFAYLCSGEKGISFADTNILGVAENKWEKYIISGDYDKNTGDGGKALVPGSGKETGGLLDRAREIGSVGGWSDKGDKEASQFYIVTKVIISGSDNTIFGKVESGIDSLVEATSIYPNMKNNFWITDCGIVLIENLSDVQLN